MSPILNVPDDDPVVSVWRWRADSQTLAMLRPVLERISQVPDQPCLFGNVPYTCARVNNQRLCAPCAHRDIRAALFGEREEADERRADGPE